MTMQLSMERQIPTAAIPTIKTVADTRKPLFTSAWAFDSSKNLHEGRDRDHTKTHKDNDERLQVSATFSSVQ
jgi:hypothetical protein